MKRRNAFTLTELLVLVPILAMLGTLLFASLDSSKQTLQAAQCLSNMRQWGLAMGMYCNDYHDYLPYDGTGSGIDSGFNLGAWYNVLPHYINQTPLKDLYNSSPPNIPLPGQRSIYICPSVTAPAPNYVSPPSTSNPYFGYAMDRLIPGLSGRTRPRSLAELPSQVIFLSESENNSFPFTDGYYIGKFASQPVPPRHSGGMNFVFVDGHAQWYKLDDYSRTVPESNNADLEWNPSKHHALYWFPCEDPNTCNKT
jgi:prepilin-type processing-associated H-X9-DG protein